MNIENIKFFVGPMSKNIVDSILEFVDETGKHIGFIPSRRQVDNIGGYVNNWTTEKLFKYVSGRIIIERDHAGSGQATPGRCGAAAAAAESLSIEEILLR